MKIAVLVSGGVDSSLALRLLRDQGHDVTAFYLKIWLEKEIEFLGSCPWSEDLHYVEALCKQLDVPLEIISLQKEYWESVVDYTILQVRRGKTPNPDMLCNQRVKFGAFYDKIDDSFEKVATGHYAQVEEVNGTFVLRSAPDPIKDQAYFLAHLSQKQLSRAMFPIGHMKKEQVRKLAAQYDIPSKDRKDSQGICFLGQIKFREFLQHHVGVRFGDIIEFETGKVIGSHDGFWYHTIGQRKGLGLSGGPWYVVSKDPLKNIVYVSNRYYEVDKNRNEFDIVFCNWISGMPPQKSNLGVKIRHGEMTYDATIDFSSSGALATGRFHVVLDQHDQGIAPGQFAVFYDGDTCLGCGEIDLS